MLDSKGRGGVSNYSIKKQLPFIQPIHFCHNFWVNDREICLFDLLGTLHIKVNKSVCVFYYLKTFH